MDIRKLQRAIVDGLEDVKGQNIAVFNTEHLSPLFERVIIASGTSNRQTKALASSVREAVKSQGFGLARTEGEENGEWIIVDCGAAVVHLMQPAIRDYYHLEEIWGDKPVKMKLDTAPVRLVKASAPETPAAAKRAAAKSAAGKAPARKTVATRTATKTAKTTAKATPKPTAKTTIKPTAKPTARSATAMPAATAAPARKLAARKTSAASTPVETFVVGSAARKAPAKKIAAKKVVARTGGVTRTVGVKKSPATTTQLGATKASAARSVPATSARAKPAPAKKVAAKKAAATRKA